MAKTNKKNTRKKNTKKEEKYNADNEIIIGVTTKPKEVRVDNQKSTRMNKEKKRTSTHHKSIQRENDKNYKNIKNKVNNVSTKEEDIKTLNRKRRILSFVFLLMIAVAGTIYFLTTPMFNIANIIIEGNSKNSIDTYISLSKIELNSVNIFAITKSSIIKNIKENPYVEDVEVKRKLPNTIQINIKEREVAYQAKYNEKYIYIDKQGYVLEINKEKENTIKILELSSTSGALQEGERLNNEDLLKLDTVLKIMNYCKYNSIENKVSSINVSDTSNYTLYLEKEGKVAYLGDATNLSERILWLKTILEKEKENKGEIFINGNLSNRKVYFKPTENKE